MQLVLRSPTLERGECPLPAVNDPYNAVPPRGREWFAIFRVFSYAGGSKEEVVALPVFLLSVRL